MEFKGRKCVYGMPRYWIFYFEPEEGSFVDEFGEEYFIRVEVGCAEELCEPWYFKRWYEHDCVDEDEMTSVERKTISEFVLAESVSVFEPALRLVLLLVIECICKN